MSHQPGILACRPVDGTPPPPKLEVTAKLCRACQRAGRVRMVWVSKAMIPRILAGELQPVCLPCSYTFLARDDLTVTLAPEQILQLADLGALSDAVSFVDRVNDVLRRRRAARKPPPAG